MKRCFIYAAGTFYGLTPKAFKRLRPMDSGAAADSEPVGGANRQLAGLLDRLMEGAHGDA